MAQVKLVEIRENDKEIMKIAERAQRVLNEEREIEIMQVNIIPTIAYEFLEQMILYLNENKKKGKNIEINLMQLMDVGISYREGDGEKEGNFTPYINPGQEMKLLVKDDGGTEEE